MRPWPRGFHLDERSSALRVRWHSYCVCWGPPDRWSTLSLPIPDTVVHPARTAGNLLQSLVDAHPGILGTVVAWADGRVFAHAGRTDHAFDPMRSAAVASSLLALSESFSRESLGSAANYSSIATDHGTLVLVRIAGHGHVLCLWTDRSENLAMTLRYALDAGERLAAALAG